jgi:hypothetical protein
VTSSDSRCQADDPRVVEARVTSRSRAGNRRSIAGCWLLRALELPNTRHRLRERLVVVAALFHLSASLAIARAFFISRESGSRASASGPQARIGAPEARRPPRSSSDDLGVGRGG